MVNVVGSRDDYSRWKPKGFEKHLTVQELADLVGRHRSRIYQLEKKKIIGAPIRVNVGELQVRLYSPEECAKIKQHFATVRPGPKPKKRSRKKSKV
jgi:hypothetical protein